MLLVNDAEQCAVLPPPFTELLHWSMSTPIAVVAPVTVQTTRPSAPPPLTELLHWVTVAFVVLCTGSQASGVSPPPSPEDPTHWSTVTPTDVGAPTTTLVMDTMQNRFPPLPLPAALHWVTEPTSWPEFVVVTVHASLGVVPAGPSHIVATTVDDVMPVARLIRLVTSAVHRTSRPGVSSIPLHWLKAVTAEADETTDHGATANMLPTATARTTNIARAVNPFAAFIVIPPVAQCPDGLLTKRCSTVTMATDRSTWARMLGVCAKIEW